jgi:hypothetical protein
MSRKLKWALVVLVVGAAAGAALFFWPGDPVTLETYERIRFGMHLKEVEVLVGSAGYSQEDFPLKLEESGLEPI